MNEELLTRKEKFTLDEFLDFIDDIIMTRECRDVEVEWLLDIKKLLLDDCDLYSLENSVRYHLGSEYRDKKLSEPMIFFYKVLEHDCKLKGMISAKKLFGLISPMSFH